MSKTLYDVLQVSQKAEIDVIDAAYTRLQSKHESDDVTLKALKLAYDTLSDPARRMSYDQRFASKVIPSSATYRSDLADASDGWWRSSMFAKIAVCVALLIVGGMYMNYSKHNKEVSVSRAATSNDSRRVDNERVYVDRSMDNKARAVDNQGRAVDNVGQTLHRNANVQDQAEARNSRTLEVITARSEEESRRRDEVMRLAKERQDSQLAREQANEQRVRDDYDRRVAQQQLARDRAELCRLEMQNHGRYIHCR